jgi:hypothetical protein
MQTKYRQKKVQLSVIKNNARTDEDRGSNFSMKPERDNNHPPDQQNRTAHVAERTEYVSNQSDSRYYGRHGQNHRESAYKSYEYEMPNYEKH